ncbi:MAG: hypothetical protein DRH97_00735 [Chloroflexi bacterium]|jgi:hypothetical protein|nr:MAG: hypothetical protein DRH97_00735 [Chloroflexota bacterium]
MGVITTGSHPKALWPGVKRWWGIGYGEHPEQYKQLFDIMSSTQNYEEDVQNIGMGKANVKNEGQSVSYDTISQGFTSRYVHTAFTKGFIVTFEEQRDNLYEKVSGSRAKATGFAMRQTKETVGANVYNRAFDSSYTGGDGKELLATDHPTDTGDQSNELAVAADFSEGALEDLLIQIGKSEDHVGNKIALMGQKLIVPVDLQFETCRVLDSVLQSGTGNNDVNALNYKGLLPGGVAINNYFTDVDAWFVMTNCPEGMTMYQRDNIGLQEDNDFDTMNLKAFSYDRYSVGWTDFRGMYGSAGA